MSDLDANDTKVFHCHKSVHSKDGGEWDDDTGEYQSSGNEKVCRGALIYMNKKKRLPVLARIAIVMGVIKLEDLDKQAELVISLPESKSGAICATHATKP